MNIEYLLLKRRKIPSNGQQIVALMFALLKPRAQIIQLFNGSIYLFKSLVVCRMSFRIGFVYIFFIKQTIRLKSTFKLPSLLCPMMLVLHLIFRHFSHFLNDVTIFKPPFNYTSAHRCDKSLRRANRTEFKASNRHRKWISALSYGKEDSLSIIIYQQKFHSTLWKLIHLPRTTNNTHFKRNTEYCESNNDIVSVSVLSFVHRPTLFHIFDRQKKNGQNQVFFYGRRLASS